MFSKKIYALFLTCVLITTLPVQCPPSEKLSIFIAQLEASIDPTRRFTFSPGEEEPLKSISKLATAATLTEDGSNSYLISAVLSEKFRDVAFAGGFLAGFSCPADITEKDINSAHGALVNDFSDSPIFHYTAGFVEGWACNTAASKQKLTIHLWSTHQLEEISSSYQRGLRAAADRPIEPHGESIVQERMEGGALVLNLNTIAWHSGNRTARTKTAIAATYERRSPTAQAYNQYISLFRTQAPSCRELQASARRTSSSAETTHAGAGTAISSEDATPRPTGIPYGWFADIQDAEEASSSTTCTSATRLDELKVRVDTAKQSILSELRMVTLSEVNFGLALRVLQAKDMDQLLFIIGFLGGLLSKREETFPHVCMAYLVAGSLKVLGISARLIGGFLEGAACKKAGEELGKEVSIKHSGSLKQAEAQYSKVDKILEDGRLRDLADLETPVSEAVDLALESLIIEITSKRITVNLNSIALIAGGRSFSGVGMEESEETNKCIQEIEYRKSIYIKRYDDFKNKNLGLPSQLSAPASQNPYAGKSENNIRRLKKLKARQKKATSTTGKSEDELLADSNAELLAASNAKLLEEEEAKERAFLAAAAKEAAAKKAEAKKKRQADIAAKAAAKLEQERLAQQAKEQAAQKIREGEARKAREAAEEEEIQRAIQIADAKETAKKAAEDAAQKEHQAAVAAKAAKLEQKRLAQKAKEKAKAEAEKKRQADIAAKAAAKLEQERLAQEARAAAEKAGQIEMERKAQETQQQQLLAAKQEAARQKVEEEEIEALRAQLSRMKATEKLLEEKTKELEDLKLQYKVPLSEPAPAASAVSALYPTEAHIQPIATPGNVHSTPPEIIPAVANLFSSALAQKTLEAPMPPKPEVSPSVRADSTLQGPRTILKRPEVSQGTKPSMDARAERANAEKLSRRYEETKARIETIQNAHHAPVVPHAGMTPGAPAPYLMPISHAPAVPAMYPSEAYESIPYGSMPYPAPAPVAYATHPHAYGSYYPLMAHHMPTPTYSAYPATPVYPIDPDHAIAQAISFKHEANRTDAEWSKLKEVLSSKNDVSKTPDDWALLHACTGYPQGKRAFADEKGRSTYVKALEDSIHEDIQKYPAHIPLAVNGRIAINRAKIRGFLDAQTQAAKKSPQ